MDNEGNLYTLRPQHDEPTTIANNNINNNIKMLVSSNIPITDHVYQKIILVWYSPKGKNNKSNNDGTTTDDDTADGDGDDMNKWRQQGDQQRASNEKKRREKKG